MTMRLVRIVSGGDVPFRGAIKQQLTGDARHPFTLYQPLGQTVLHNFLHIKDKQQLINKVMPINTLLHLNLIKLHLIIV